MICPLCEEHIIDLADHLWDHHQYEMRGSPVIVRWGEEMSKDQIDVKLIQCPCGCLVTSKANLRQHLDWFQIDSTAKFINHLVNGEQYAATSTR